MAIGVTKDLLAGDKRGHYRRIWQLNRHLAINLNAKLNQLNKASNTNITILNEKIEILRKELKAQKNGKMDFVPNLDSSHIDRLSKASYYPYSQKTISRNGNKSVRYSISVSIVSQKVISIAW